MGEFGWKEVLKQFLDEDRAKQLSAAWDGDVYATWEQKESKRTLFAAHIRLANGEIAARFLWTIFRSPRTEIRRRKNLIRQPDFFSFNTLEGGVFFAAQSKEFVSLEGADRPLFLRGKNLLAGPPLPANRKNPPLA